MFSLLYLHFIVWFESAHFSGTLGEGLPWAQHTLLNFYLLNFAAAKHAKAGHEVALEAYNNANLMCRHSQHAQQN